MPKNIICRCNRVYFQPFSSVHFFRDTYIGTIISAYIFFCSDNSRATCPNCFGHDLPKITKYMIIYCLLNIFTFSPSYFFRSFMQSLKTRVNSQTSHNILSAEVVEQVLKTVYENFPVCNSLLTLNPAARGPSCPFNIPYL